ncbi:MAG: complex I NDUFA9 subunit family protein, partial [Rickettsiales bacterium]|nr:complex I NDUFA9 subunit family protein [Rickettsiales bacterium]
MEQQVVTVIGGSGFVGRYVVKLLADAGYTIRVISRNANAALHLKTCGSVGQIVLMSGNIAEPTSLIGKIENSYAVINLAGLLFEGGKQKFASVHAHGAEKLAQMAKAAGVQRFVQMSALGVDKARTSDYARTKLLGEKAVLSAFPEASIIRPSVIFGPEDNFFNQFA